MKKEVLYPAARAFITGLFAALLAVMVSYFRGSPSWALGGLIGSITALIAWLAVILPAPKRQQLPIYPTTTRIQITGDSSSFTAGRFADLPISREDLQRVAKRLAAGAGFGHSGLAGPGRPLSRSQFEVLRDEFISRGLAYWINPASHAQGVELTHAGRRVMSYFAARPCSKTIPQQKKGNNTVTLLSSAAHAHERASGNGREVILDT